MPTELINNEERKHGLIIIVYLGYNNHKSLARKIKENEVNKYLKKNTKIRMSNEQPLEWPKKK